MKSQAELLTEYPMIATKVRQEADYVAPKDYERLLKVYAFSGRTDLQIFEDFLRTTYGSTKEVRRQIGRVLELGCGTGRATQSLLNTIVPSELHLLDLSPQMLMVAGERFGGRNDIVFIQSDTIANLEMSKIEYDLIFSIWSFSHSVHQVLGNHTLEQDKERIRTVVRRTVERMMKPGSHFFVIHVDSQSDEQRILFKQWAKSYPMFSDASKQTPSKLLLDEVLEKLRGEGTIEFTVDHLVGDPIVYSSLEEALDVFLNFHLESHFNQKPQAEEVTEEIKEYLLKFKQPDGTIIITPGCFIYRVKKL